MFETGQNQGLGRRIGGRLEVFPPAEVQRVIVGCMSGTSCDGVDAAMVEISGIGLNIAARVVKCAGKSYGDTGENLRKLADQTPLSAGIVADLALELAQKHLELLREMIGGERVDMVVIHGQTIYHAPPLSWQLLNPAPIAYGLGLPVLFDLRAADLAHGGQGAPLTPMADFILFRDPLERRCIVNLGGYCNITMISNWLGEKPAVQAKPHWVAALRGKDVCSCNQLLDRLAREMFGEPFDRDGAHAAEGRIDEDALAELHHMLSLQMEESRSLGTGDELTGWLSRWKSRVRGEDLARTACAGIATVISRRGPLDRRILAGGGVKNRILVDEIMRRSSKPVSLSDEYGVPAAYREAVAMAVLGALCWDRVPITLPQVTGAIEQFVSGSWVLP